MLKVGLDAVLLTTVGAKYDSFSLLLGEICTRLDIEVLVRKIRTPKCSILAIKFFTM